MRRIGGDKNCTQERKCSSGNRISFVEVKMLEDGDSDMESRAQRKPMSHQRQSGGSKITSYSGPMTGSLPAMSSTTSPDPKNVFPNARLCPSNRSQIVRSSSDIHHELYDASFINNRDLLRDEMHYPMGSIRADTTLILDPCST